jgi:hypothetical protein
MVKETRSLLDSILASAAGLFFAGGLLLAPSPAEASKGYKPPKGSGINRPPPGIVALYGVPAKPIVTPKPAKPPKYFPEYGVFVPQKPPKKAPPLVALYGVPSKPVVKPKPQPPKYFPEYGVFVPTPQPPKKDPPRYFPEYGVFVPGAGK